jgi:TPP-dependent pyruvate/acetoin dehydrogenase alpha subunit
MRPDDYLIGIYRTPGHAIARGTDPRTRWRENYCIEREWRVFGPSSSSYPP